MVNINEIMEKREQLYALAPFPEGVKTLKRRSDLLDFTYSDMRLFGSTLTRHGVRMILEGNTIASAPVFEHRLCEAHKRLLLKFMDKLDMRLEVDTVLLNEFCTVLTGLENPVFRQGEPLLYHLGFVPGDDESISKDLAKMFSAIKRDDVKDFCLKAALVHLGVVKVYPYEGGVSEMAARAAMQYTLMQAGFFPVDIGVSEPDYNRVTANGIRTGDAEEFAGLLRAAIFKKLCFLLETIQKLC